MQENDLPQVRQGLLEHYRAKKLPAEKVASTVVRHLEVARQMLSDPASTILVALQHDEIVGFTSGINEREGKAAAIWTFSFKKPEAPNKGAGIGTMLFKAKLQALMNKGAKTITGSSVGGIASKRMIEKAAGELELQHKFFETDDGFSFKIERRTK